MNSQKRGLSESGKRNWLFVLTLFLAVCVVLAPLQAQAGPLRGGKCPPGCSPSDCRFDPQTGTISCECECQVVETVEPQNTPTPPPPETPQPTPTPPPTPTPCMETHLQRVCTDWRCLVGVVEWAYVVDYWLVTCDGIPIAILWKTCEICEPTPTPRPPEPPEEDECEDVVIGEEGMECISEYEISVSSTCPVPQVGRSPYPRGMVRVPNSFWVVAPEIGGVAWSEKLPQGIPNENTRNWQLGLRWRRLYPPFANGPILDPPPPATAWDWDERPWNIAAGVEKGVHSETATHTYLTSSWGKPRNGPDGLPSYQVTNQTYWAAEWAIRYEHYECVEEERECVQRAQPNYSGCGDLEPDKANDPYWQVVRRCLRREWVNKFDGWHVFDLREYGNPTWWFTRQVLEPVPIIEVQGVIQDER